MEHDDNVMRLVSVITEFCRTGMRPRKGSGTNFRKRCLFAVGDSGKDEAWRMVTLRNRRASKGPDLVTEFACRACGSPAVVYPDRLSDDAPIKCQRCRTVLCTVREFRLSATQETAGI
jgi:hypothetical protein